jgi:hypothetical protein
VQALGGDDPLARSAEQGNGYSGAHAVQIAAQLGWRNPIAH